ncbi:hypothetical protein HK099_007004, partial [Clydaea vesicula]
TFRKQVQYKFAQDCLDNPPKTIEDFNCSRKNKYIFYENISGFNKGVSIDKIYNNPPFYFNPWLSGFIEAEGNFNLVFKEGRLHKSAFSIGQKGELHVINMIKTKFKSNNKILQDKIIISNKFKSCIFIPYYRLHLYNAVSRKYLFEH